MASHGGSHSGSSAAFSPRGILAARFVDSPASEQSADYAADQSTWTATAAMTMSTAPAAMMGRMLVIGLAAAAGIGVCR